MPKTGSGYKSVTITQSIHDYYRKSYEQNREKLERKGINSFTSYITSMLEALMEENEIFARYAPFLQEFGFDEVGNTVYIKDNRTGRIAGIGIKDKELHCDVDDRSDCVHVGFAYSVPTVYKVMEKLGVPPPKVKG
jgi:virulence-associated protein VapD